MQYDNDEGYGIGSRQNKYGPSAVSMVEAARIEQQRALMDRY